MPVLLTSFKSGAATRHHLNDDRDAACSKRMSRSMGFRRDSFNSGRKRRLPRRRQAPDLVTENFSSSRDKVQHSIAASRLSHKKACRNSRVSFPLCLVCDPRAPRPPQDSDLEKLARRLEADFDLTKELSQQVDRKGQRQRIKVLEDLRGLDAGVTRQRMARLQETLQATVGEGKEMTLGTKCPDDGNPKQPATKQKTSFRPVMPKSPVRAEVLRTHSEGQDNLEKNRNSSSSISAKMPVKEKKKVPARDDKKNKKWKNRILRREGPSKDMTQECMERIEVGKEQLVRADDIGEETDVSITFSSSNMKTSPNKKKLQKNGNGRPTVGQGPSSTNRDDADFFAELVIDELQRLNAELKFSVATREEQLKRAVKQIHQLEEDKSRLAKRLDETVLRARQQAEDMAQEINFKEDNNMAQMQKLLARIPQLSDEDIADALTKKNKQAETVRILTSKLRESNEKNAELMAYIRKLSESYMAAFGNADTKSSLSKVKLLEEVYKAH